MAIDAVFFDLNGTLLDDDLGMYLALSETVEELATDLHAGFGESILITYPEVSERFWNLPTIDLRLPGDPASIAEFRGDVWAQTLSTLGVNDPVVAERAAVVYARARRRHQFDYEESTGALKALQGKKLLGLITNGPG